MRLFYLGTPQDANYLQRLKACVGSAQVSYSLEPIQTWVEVKHHCEKRGITNVFSSSASLLKILLHRQNEKKAPAISNYAGSMFFRDGISIVFVNPLDHIISVTYGEHLLRRYISKLTSPESWVSSTPFVWDIVTPTNVEKIFESYKSAFAIAVDIETFKEKLAIRCCGYTAIFIDTSSGKVSTHSCVIPLDSVFNLVWVRKFNSLPIPKILQNGKYDHAYLARYNAPCSHYFWDTINLFHCWYSELPKDLAFIQGYTLRESMYWKDLAQTSDLAEYYQYNCRDTHATANGWISMMLELPDYARTNYLMEFPLVFPAHLCEMTGIKRDMQELEVARGEVDTEISTHSTSLDKMLGVTNFNVNSPIQMKALLKILGCGDLESADEKNLAKAAFRHPLNSRIINHVLEVRGLRKLKSTYLRVDSDAKANGEGGAKEFESFILYALNPHGTDTGRLASREHHFWCGLQIQNIPRDKSVKRTLVARPGYRLVEADLEQAESRDTAFIAGDETMQAAVSGSRDFHSVNASAFFGMSYESLYDDITKHTKNKQIRDLAKRVNHGANYNMGAGVLIETMGLEKTYEAGRLLNLPRHYTPKQIAEHLLSSFHKTYPQLVNTYYAGVLREIKLTHMLVSKVVGTPAWSRYCFGHPDTNKRDLNSYVAHCPQSLNAMTLNRAFMRVFYEVALPNPTTFHLLAQVHDSILFEFKEGHEHLMYQVQEMMQIPVRVIGYDGKEREFTVPSALKAGKDGKGAHRWSETE